MSEELFSPPLLIEDTRAVSADTISTNTTSTSTSRTSSQQSSIERRGKGKLRECSMIWKEFTKFDKDGESKVKCNHCSVTYKFVNSSTTNMWEHFEQSHKIKQARAIDVFLTQV